MGRLTPWWRIFAFVEFFLATLSVIAVPKATVAVLGILAAVAVAVLRRERVPAIQWVGWGGPSYWIASLAAWSAITSLWSPVPLLTLAAAGFLIVITVATEVVVTSSRHAPLPLARSCALGLVAGMLIILAFLSWEAFTDQSLSRWVFTHFPALRETVGKHVFLTDGVVVRVSEASNNRRLVIATLLLLPFAAYLFHAPRISGRRPATLAAAFLYAAAIALTKSLTSQLAFLAGGLTLILAQVRLRLIRPTLAVLWTCAVLLPIPIALGLSAANMQNTSLLPRSAQERVIIGSVYAKEVLRRPLLGIGAVATPAVQGPFQTLEFPERAPRSRFSATHPHNAYLQVWYELGAPGALLLLGLGLSILSAISRLSANFQPYAFAQFSVVATLVASSYGIWQHWFLSAIALGVIALRLVDVVVRRGTLEAEAPEVVARAI